MSGEQEEKGTRAPRLESARLDSAADLNALRLEAHTDDPFAGALLPTQLNIWSSYQGTPGEQVRELISAGNIDELCNRARLDSGYQVANLGPREEFLVQQTFIKLLSREYASGDIKPSMRLAYCLNLDDAFVSAQFTRLLEQSVEAQPTVATIRDFIRTARDAPSGLKISPNTEPLSALVKEYLTEELALGDRWRVQAAFDVFQINFTHEERVALEPSAARMCVAMINSGNLCLAEQLRNQFDVSDDTLVLKMLGQEQISNALWRAARHFSPSAETLIDFVLAQEANPGVVAKRVVSLFPGAMSQMEERIVSMSEAGAWAPAKVAALLTLLSSTDLNRPDLLDRACAVILRQK